MPRSSPWSGALAAGGNPFTAAAGAFFLGVRNAFYGLRLSQLLALPRAVRPFAAQWVIDETTAVALAQPTRRAARIGFTVTGLSLYVLWNLTTLLGALGAEAIGDTDAWGLDAAGPAVFLALLAPMLRTAGGAGRRRCSPSSWGSGCCPCCPPECRSWWRRWPRPVRRSWRGGRAATARRTRDRDGTRQGGGPMNVWIAIGATAVGCYVVKLVGLLGPRRRSWSARSSSGSPPCCPWPCWPRSPPSRPSPTGSAPGARRQGRGARRGGRRAGPARPLPGRRRRRRGR